MARATTVPRAFLGRRVPRLLLGGLRDWREGAGKPPETGACLVLGPRRQEGKGVGAPDHFRPWAEGRGSSPSRPSAGVENVKSSECGVERTERRKEKGGQEGWRGGLNKKVEEERGRWKRPSWGGLLAKMNLCGIIPQPLKPNHRTNPKRLLLIFGRGRETMVREGGEGHLGENF